MMKMMLHTTFLLTVLCAAAHALSLTELIRELQNIQGSIEEKGPASSHQGAAATYTAPSGGRAVYESKGEENYIVETHHAESEEEYEPPEEAPPPDFCITEGYFLPMDGEQCKYLQCVVHKTQWSDAYGNVNIDTLEKPCPSGTKVSPDFRGGYHPPCTVISSQCVRTTPEPPPQTYDMRESARQVDLHPMDDDYTQDYDMDYSPAPGSVSRGGGMNRPPPPPHYEEPSVNAYANHVDAESEQYQPHYHSEFVHQATGHLPASKPPKKKKMEDVAKLMMMVLKMMKDIEE